MLSIVLTKEPGREGATPHRRRRPAITEDLGLRLESLTLEDLGRAKRVTVDKDNTTIVEGAGKREEKEREGKEWEGGHGVQRCYRELRGPDRGRRH